MAYIPNTTVKPQLSSPNSMVNPYDGSVRTAINSMFDKGIGVINKELADRATEQQALQNLRTEQFNTEYAADLKQTNIEYATLVSAGQASMDPESYKQFAVERFNKLVRDKQWYFQDKVARAAFEQKAYSQIMQGYENLMSTDLKNVAQDQMAQLVAAKMDGALQQAGNADASVEKILAPFYSQLSNSTTNKSSGEAGANGKALTNKAGKGSEEAQPNKADNANQGSKFSMEYRDFASKAYEVNGNAKIDLYFRNNDVNSLTKLQQEVDKNTLFTKDQRKSLIDKINLSKQNIEGKKEAVQYLNSFKKADGTPDMEAILKELADRVDLDADKQATVKAQLTRIAEHQETEYQANRTAVFDKLVQGGDAPDSILLNDGQALREKDKLLIRDYAKVTASNYDLYNQLQQKIMRMDKVDLISDGLGQLTPNDLKSLQTLQVNLKDNSDLQKQAFSVNKLMDANFKKINITDKNQQQDLYAMVLEEIRGRGRVKGESMTSFEVSQLIKEFMRSVE